MTKQDPAAANLNSQSEANNRRWLERWKTEQWVGKHLRDRDVPPVAAFSCPHHPGPNLVTVHRVEQQLWVLFRVGFRFTKRQSILWHPDLADQWSSTPQQPHMPADLAATLDLGKEGIVSDVRELTDAEGRAMQLDDRHWWPGKRDFRVTCSGRLSIERDGKTVHRACRRTYLFNADTVLQEVQRHDEADTRPVTLSALRTAVPD